jgi:hypothetical protein
MWERFIWNCEKNQQDTDADGFENIFWLSRASVVYDFNVKWI